MVLAKPSTSFRWVKQLSLVWNSSPFSPHITEKSSDQVDLSNPEVKVARANQAWWNTPLIPVLEAEAGGSPDLWVWGQPDLQSGLQNSQGYRDNPHRWGMCYPGTGALSSHQRTPNSVTGKQAPQAGAGWTLQPSWNRHLHLSTQFSI